MLTRIRQVATITHDLDRAVGLYSRVLGIQATPSRELPAYGLRNAILPTGRGTFLEVLAPTDPQSAGARFLERRGEGVYLLIFQVDNLEEALGHLDAHGVQVTGRSESVASKSAFLHPRGINGAFIELVQPAQPQSWPEVEPGGEQEPVPGALVQQIRQVVVLVRDLEGAIQRWETLFGIKATNRLHVDHGDLDIAILPVGKSGTFIELATPGSPSAASQRFLDKVGEGLYLLIFQTQDLEASEAAIRKQGEAQITQVLPPGGNFRSLWLHPRSMKGVFTQLSHVSSPDNPWPPAGDGWYR